MLNRLILLPQMLYREKIESLFIAGTGFLILDADLSMKVKTILCWHLILITLIRESTKCSLAGSLLERIKNTLQDDEFQFNEQEMMIA